MHVLSKTIKMQPNSSLKRVRSYDDLNKTCELSLNDIKILLCCDHSSSLHDQLSHRVRKQQILEKNKLVDPLKLFGMNPSHSILQSARNNSSKLSSMFESLNGSKNSSLTKTKCKKKETLIMGKSLNNYLRQNKQNYQRNGANNIQKMRIKLKIGKKMP